MTLCQHSLLAACAQAFPFMHVRVRTFWVDLWGVARWVFRLVPESSINNSRQSAPPNVEIISSRNALSCSLPGHTQLFNWTNSLYFIHFLLWSLTIALTIMHCLTDLRTKLVFLSWFSYYRSLVRFQASWREGQWFLLVLSSSPWKAQHHGPCCPVTDVRGLSDYSFSVQSVRRGQFTGGSWACR